MFSRFNTKRAAYSVYLFSEFAVALLFSMMFTVDGVYQVSMVGLNALQLVLVGTTLEVAAFIFEVPTGVVADVFSRRLSIIIGMFVMGLGFIVEGSFPFFAPILLAQVLWALGYTFTSGATEAWIADEVGEARAGQAFLRAGQIGAIGSLIGIVPGILIGLLGANIPIVLGGALLMALGVVLIVIMPETGFKPTPREDRNTFQSMVHTFKSGLRVVRASQR
jgi:DHA3 family tetracycline resistance protein-like MFS transporter